MRPSIMWTFWTPASRADRAERTLGIMPPVMTRSLTSRSTPARSREGMREAGSAGLCMTPRTSEM